MTTIYGCSTRRRDLPDWAACLQARLRVPDPRYRERLAAEVPGLDGLTEELEGLLPRLYDGEPRLVHVDYFPGNVMAEQVGRESAGEGSLADFRISGVFDFAAHSLFGDPLLDVVGAIVMADITTDVSADEQRRMAERAERRAGPRWRMAFSCYRAFYGLYYAMDPDLLPWCTNQLRSTSLAR